MLKWTVGPKKTPGASKRSPSVSVGPCLNIRRAAARLHLRRSAPSTSAASSVRRATVRALARGKENGGYASDEAPSPRTRDSVYMRLDAMPAALRDVSNRIPTSGTPGSGTKRSRSRSRTRKARPSLLSRFDSPSVVPQAKRAASPPGGDEETSQNLINSSLVRRRLSQPGVTLKCEPDCQIDFSPCPMRATRSLVGLRRRLTDAFLLPSPPQTPRRRSYDNPLYFAVSPTAETPKSFNVLELSCARVHSGEPASQLEEKPIAASEALSPLTRHMESLKLSGAEDGALRHPRVGAARTADGVLAHDVTDPKFLSMCVTLDSSAVVRQGAATPDKDEGYPSDPSTATAGTSACDRGARKRRSLRRSRTYSEEGPPSKVMSMPPTDDHVCSEPIKTPSPLDESRPRLSSKRRRSRSVEAARDEGRSLAGIGDGVFTDKNSICDSLFSDHYEKSSFDSSQEEFTLKRQGGIRRKQRGYLNESSLNVHKHSQHFGLTLPVGVPSPFSPENAHSWFSMVAPSQSLCNIALHKSYCIAPGPNSSLPRSTTWAGPASPVKSVARPPPPLGPPNFWSTLDATNAPEVARHKASSQGHSSQYVAFCADKRNQAATFVNPAPRFFGLTLSRGIPSPPTPGVEVLASSPVNDVSWQPSSSDETWNSHSLQCMTTPRSRARRRGNDEVLSDAESSSVQPDSEGKDSFGSVDPSPMAMVERSSRSRRCLLFASPGGSTHQRRSASRRFNPCRRPSDVTQTSKGELDLAIYEAGGLLTIHVISGRNFHKVGGRTSNAYVKVALVPSVDQRTFHRTAVHRDSSAPRFDQRFSFELLEPDLEKRILVSVWHRDKERRRSEFLGCMSFAVKHAVKKEVSGSFRLLSQVAGRSQHVSSQVAVMARQSDSSVEEIISLEESDAPPTPAERRRASCPPKKAPARTAAANSDDSSFLRHLELEPNDEEVVPGKESALAVRSISLKGGRTPFTTTRTLSRQKGMGFGFSIAWTQPPRIERVEPGLPADQAGLRPGDYVIFVEKENVVTLPEEEILELIRSCGNQLTLEVYRRSNANGIVKSEAAPSPSPAKHRSSITCSAATTTSLELSKRRLHLPQVTFSSEAEPLNREDARRRAVYQLASKEQQYALSLQFGVSRFLVPLSERKDLMSCAEHETLFQNIEELLRLSEDILEVLIQEENEPLGQYLGRVYLKKVPLLSAAYKRYCCGLKMADCHLVTMTKNNEFMRIISEPAVPRRRPDLTAFLHKPLEHYREMLKLLQTILNFTKVNDEDYPAMSRVVQELQVTYREMTVSAGLMEPEGEGRLLLSLQDLESRLVFTRCKPFVLSAPGRQWIFGGDLSRVEGRAVRPFWGLLFSDMILFAKVSRDRVLFITEEPLSLLAVTQACFSIKKKATDFRLLMDGGPEGEESPAAPGCGPDMTRSRSAKKNKNTKRRTISLRAPTPELKAVWQNLIQRQIIYLNTARGGTPTSSPLDSPDQPTTLSVATLDSLSRRQTPLPECKSLGDSQRHLDELIEHKCRQLGKSGASKGSALHLSQWMKGQLGGGPVTPDEEPEPEVWSPATLRRRSEQLQLIGVTPARSESQMEEFAVSDTEGSPSRSTERSPTRSVDSQVTVKSGGGEQPVAMCRECHKTCLANNNNNNPTGDRCALDDEPDYEDENDNWGPLMLMGMSALSATIGLGTQTTQDPFSPAELPQISVLPPTPETISRTTGFQWEDADMSLMAARGSSGSRSPDTTLHTHEEISEMQDDDSLPDEDPPYRALSSGGLKRFGTLASLEMFGTEEEDAAEDSTDSEDDDEWDSDAEDTPEGHTDDLANASQQLEAVTQSFRGWTARAGSFVAEKMALFERLGEDSRAAAFLDRYLRPTTETQDSPPNGVTSCGGEDSNSAATSGEEVWGTPTSGGELLDEELSGTGDASGVSFESPRESVSSPGAAEDDTELMMDELLASTALTSRGFPPRRRLEPLPEEEDVESAASTPSSPPPAAPVEETPSPEQGSGVGGVADSYLVRRAANVATLTAQDILRHQPPSFLNRLKLRRRSDEQPRPKGNGKLLGFLSKRGEDTRGGRPLFRLFHKDAVDDIPTTLPPRQVSMRLQNDKQLERRFWKQLRRRRSSGNAVPAGVLASPQVAT